MSEPELSPCAALVRRYDPELFQTALFAAEPGRERLMVLYAFDIELARAAARRSEVLIARMRLQFWRDVVADIRAGGGPRAHEVAAPLHRLAVAAELPLDPLDAMISAYEAELEGGFDKAGFLEWAEGRFGGRLALAASALAPGSGAPAALRALAHALGAAFALRTAVKMAADGAPGVFPDLTEIERGALARGETLPSLAVKARDLAAQGLLGLREARDQRRRVPRAALPALLDLWRAEHALRRARRRGYDFVRHQTPPRGRTAAYLWRGLTGRW